MKKIIVNDETCIGCGACIAIDNEHFDFNDDGRSCVISNENLESNDLSNAIESCPVAAISIEKFECDCDNDCQYEDEKSCDNECQCSCDGCHCCDN